MNHLHSRRTFLKLAGLGSALVSTPQHALSLSDTWPERNGRSQQVLVLGAGMAGLSAAFELRRLGHDVQVLEGQLRAGGRVQTVREPFADQLYADVGAARIPENHDWTMHFIERYNLELTPFRPSELDYLHIIKGEKLRYKAGQLPPLTAYPVDLTEREREIGWQGISTEPFKEIIENMGDPKSKEWPPLSIASYDKYSFKEYLEEKGYSRAVADLLMLGWEEKEGLNVSILEMMRELSLSFGAPRNKIIGGNDRLPRKMAEELSNIIQYGARVLSVRQTESAVRVIVARGGVQIEHEVDRIICTFPPPVLSRMDFLSTLSAPKQRAIRNVNFWKLSRSVVQVSDRYWREEGFNGFVVTDRPLEIWDPLYESGAKRGLIAAYIKNDDCEKLIGVHKEAQLNFAVQQIEVVFPGLHKYVEGGYTKNWGEDPWSGLANVIASRGQMVDIQPHLSTPEGRIHFAGEHTSAYHGWIQGAIESGHRAAREIHERS